MKLINTTKLQEPKTEQYSIIIGKETKEMLKGMGWKKGSKVGIFRHGAGLFITMSGISQNGEDNNDK